MRANAAARLAQHYVDNYRSLPWRVPPGDDEVPDPYRVWLSEVMLQQTTVATVRPRFERFVARWPTVDALAAASDDDILSEWAGLGYYARARNLIACARQVASMGGFPTSRDGLRALPGVGDYTAAASAAIAFGERAPAVDTNIRRVVSRVHGLAEPTTREVEERFLAWLPAARPGDTVQAVMDLGATICTPRSPRCTACPLIGDCRAAASGAPEDFSRAKAKKERPGRYGIAWWTERDSAVWLVRRPAKGLLGAMPALPGSEWTESQPIEGDVIARVNHGFTHFALDLAIIGRDDPVGDGWWCPLDAIGEAGLPTLYLKAVKAVMAARSKGACGHARERLEEALGEP